MGKRDGKKRRRRVRFACETVAAAAAIGVVVAIIGLIGIGPRFAHDSSIRAHGIAATATVVGVNQYSYGRDRPWNQEYYPVLRTVIDGKTLDTGTKAYSVSDGDRFTVGATEPVVYDSRDATRIVPAWDGARRDLTQSFWLIAGLGIASVVAGPAAFLVRRANR